MDAIIEKTSKFDQKIAIDSIKTLKFSKKKERTIKIEIAESGEIIIIPTKAFKILRAVLKNMAEGNSIAIIPSNSELTTQEAANILNISRPHLVKLLENGKIPFTKVGSHRRIELKDIVTFENKLSKQRRTKLNKLTEQAQKLKLGYN